MSTPLPPRSPHSPAPNATKQLLEELDVLMQRMLALPVNELGEHLEAGTQAEPESDATPAATATAAGRPPVEDRAPAEEVSPSPPKMSPEVVGTRLITSHEASPARPAPHRQQDTGPSVPPEPKAPAGPESGEVPLPGVWPYTALQIPDRRETPARQTTLPPREPPPPVRRRSPSVAGQTRAALRPQTGWWLHALLWSNRTFDNCTCLLGPPGRWLRGRVGRAVLGWLGIGLLLGGLGWGLGNWFDWTW